MHSLEPLLFNVSANIASANDVNIIFSDWLLVRLNHLKTLANHIIDRIVICEIKKYIVSVIIDAIEQAES